MLSSENRLNAIAWKCAEKGVSYGRLVNQCSAHDLHVIYQEYEALLEERKKKNEELLESRTESSSKKQSVFNYGRNFNLSSKQKNSC